MLVLFPRAGADAIFIDANAVRLARPVTLPDSGERTTLTYDACGRVDVVEVAMEFADVLVILRQSAPFAEFTADTQLPDATFVTYPVAIDASNVRSVAFGGETPDRTVITFECGGGSQAIVVDGDPQSVADELNTSSVVSGGSEYVYNPLAVNEVANWNSQLVEGAAAGMRPIIDPFSIEEGRFIEFVFTTVGIVPDETSDAVFDLFLPFDAADTAPAGGIGVSAFKSSGPGTEVGVPIATSFVGPATLQVRVAPSGNPGAVLFVQGYVSYRATPREA